MSASARKRCNGRSASTIRAATRSAALSAATPASASPERAGLALASKSLRSENVYRVESIVQASAIGADCTAERRDAYDQPMGNALRRSVLSHSAAVLLITVVLIPARWAAAAPATHPDAAERIAEILEAQRSERHIP